MSLSLAYPRVTTVGDFVALLKPRVMSLVIFTGLAGMVAAPGHVHPLTAFTALLCIAVAAGASGCLNMAYDSDIDRLMSRTAARPIPMGYVDRADALGFGWSLSIAAVATMWLFAGLLPAALLAFTVFVYVGVYTLWLKRRTPQNIVIGGLSGAMPPALGWAAVADSVPAEAWLLVLIIFIWTPPHFWALALYRTKDYENAGLPMLPVTHGQKLTRLHILLYSVALFATTLLPYVIRMSGLVYLASAVALGVVFVGYAWKLYRHYSDELARRLFRYSILYLSLLFAALLVDHWL